MAVLKESAINKIKQIIERRFNFIILMMSGKKFLSPSDVEELEKQGFKTENNKSIMDYVYNHNYLNTIDENAPTSLEGMVEQQSPKGFVPKGEAHDISKTYLAATLAQHLQKEKANASSKIESVVRDNNNAYKFNALQNLDRQPEIDELVKEGTLSKMKNRLRDLGGEFTTNWSRIVNTEVSNAIGMGSVDRIVNQNKESDLQEVYVYRVTVGDAAVCKYCKRFYEDSDGSPVLYKLSTLLNNGSNYGKKPDAWLPVTLATHPNERCSQIMELKPGFKLLPGGGLTFIGRDKWKEYVQNKLRS